MGSTVFPPAASGPTLSEITSAGTSAGWGATGGSWTLINSQAANSATSVTFSGLSGYKQYKLIAANIAGSANTTVRVRVNGNSSSNYNMWGYRGFEGQTNARHTYIWNDNGHQLLDTQSGTGVNQNGQMIFYDANISGVSKTFRSTSGFYYTYTYSEEFDGVCVNETAAISSITVLFSSGTFAAGTFYLLGMN